MAIGRYSYRGHARPWQRRPLVRRRSRWAVAGVSGAFLAVVGLAWAWRVQSVEVTGGAIVPNAAVRDAVLSALQGSRWGVFPRSSMLLLRPRAIARTLEEQFAFAGVSVRRRLNGAALIRVTERPIVALVRRTDSSAVLLAGSGHLVAPAPTALNGAEGLLEIRWGGLLPDLGERLMSPETLDLLRAIWSELGTSGGSLQPLYLSDRVGLRTAFDFHTTGGTVVSVETMGDAAAHQLTKLRAVLRQYATPDARARIRIIDLRYGDRVYVQ